VITYPEFTTTALQINALTLETLETFTVLGITYLTLVWALSALIRVIESRLAYREERAAAVIIQPAEPLPGLTSGSV
jgi:ABC-type amino acid transport system permease subunit